MQEKLGFVFKYKSSVPVPLMHETRTCYTNVITKSEWKEKNKLILVNQIIKAVLRFAGQPFDILSKFENFSQTHIKLIKCKSRAISRLSPLFSAC